MAANIRNLLSLSAMRNPHKTAVFFNDERITYKDLVAVPIYTQMKATETAHILVQSNAKMCFADQQHLGVVENAARESAWSGLPRRRQLLQLKHR